MSKLKFPKLFSSYFINACFKKIKVYIVVKISSRTILQYLPFCSISFGYGENKKNWLTKLKFPKLFSSDFMNACSKKIKVYIFEKISSRTILQYLPFCSISFGYGENKKNWLTKLKFPKLFSSWFHERLFQKNKSLYFWKDIVLDYSTVQFCSLYHFVLISFGYGENKKNWLSKLKFPKLFSSDFINACFKKIKVYIFEKISFWTILQSLQFCSLIWLRRK